MTTIDNIIYDAKRLLRSLEEIDENGVTYYTNEAARQLAISVDEYERQQHKGK